MPLPPNLLSTFDHYFRGTPDLVARAPGRVNLIGEHTDYNDGFVLPMAINRNVWLAARPRPDRKVVVNSLQFDESITFSLDRLSKGKNTWEDYIQAIAWVLQEEGFTLQGWEGVITSDVPVGSGLSSSAALELAVARCFIALSGAPWDPVAMATAAQRAENEWVGMNCGIMDQLISAVGQKGQGVFIDCRSLACEPVHLPGDTSVIILDTATRRGLVDSAYNERRVQCETAAKHFGVDMLRDVTWSRLKAEAHLLDDLTLRRARHVILENERTQAAVEAMRANKADLLGQLMNESHNSLRDDYEVTNEALNTMVDLARAESSCFGARMTGAGFGGCAIALVQSDHAESFMERVSNAYNKTTGLTPSLYLTQAEQGASLENHLLHP